MASQRYYCRECTQEHESEIWYARERARGTTEYICSFKYKRSDLESGWEQLPVLDNSVNQ